VLSAFVAVGFAVA
ncbi:MAG: hypothetical protein CO108_21970, partial [Deltaproteobacteria bacterium CG_4_9_14_3_um_filter_63_12]